MEELRGLIAKGVLPEVLRGVFETRRSGILHLACGAERSDLDFREGYLANAETTIPGARLGDLLVRIGFLSASDRDACLEMAALSHERLGQALLRHGLLDAELLAQGLALQMRDVLARTLAWTSGVYMFIDVRPRAADDSASAPPRLDPREVLLDAMWTLVGEPAIDAILGDLKRPMRRSDRAHGQPPFRLLPADEFLLARINGVRSAEALLKEASLPIGEAKACLAGLLALGAVEYTGAPPPSSISTELARTEVSALALRLNSIDPFEVLDVSPETSSDMIRAAYLRLLKACDPAMTADPEFQPLLVRMSDRLHEAFKEIERRRLAPRAIPARPPAPPTRSTAPPPPSPAVVVAQPSPSVPKAAPPASVAHAEPATPPKPFVDPAEALEVAARLSDEGRLHEAIAVLHEAIPLLAGRARRSARVRKARILLVAESGTRLAEEELKAAIAEDPTNVEARIALGDIFRNGGATALATSEYRRALEVQPRNQAARDGLQALSAGVPAPKATTSTLKRIFGR